MSAPAHMPQSDIVIPVTKQDEAITDYAIGNLSPAKHAIMACAIEMNADMAEAAAIQTSIAASLLSDAKPVALSPLLIGETLERLNFERPTTVANDEVGPRLAPKPLRDLMNGVGLREISWKSLIPGVAVHDVLGNRKTRNGDRLYLLRAKGGMHMPEHSHTGEEWTLILTGSYTVDGKTYRRGDLHMEDAEETHSPDINEGEDCICLVMAQGPLVMKSWLPKMVQKVVGI